MVNRLYTHSGADRTRSRSRWSYLSRVRVVDVIPQSWRSSLTQQLPTRLSRRKSNKFELEFWPINGDNGENSRTKVQGVSADSTAICARPTRVESFERRTSKKNRRLNSLDHDRINRERVLGLRWPVGWANAQLSFGSPPPAAHPIRATCRGIALTSRSRS